MENEQVPSSPSATPESGTPLPRKSLKDRALDNVRWLRKMGLLRPVKQPRESPKTDE